MFGRYVSLDKGADAEILTRVSIALILLQRPALRSVEPSVLNGRVTLRGALPSTADCLLAVEAIRRVAGVRGVVDRLRIAPQSQPAPAPVQRTRREFHPVPAAIAG